MISIVTLTSCDKSEPYETKIPPPLAHFGGPEVQTYAVVSASTAPYRILIGTTDVSDVDRTITFTVTSSTGATAGTHYTLDNTTGSVTIPAGEAAAYVNVQGIFAPYDDTGRKDTLIFRVTEPSVEVAGFQNTLKLFMRGPCFEGDLVLEDLLGTYANTNETLGGSPYGPYTTTVSAVEQTSPTTGTITVTNIFASGWAPIKFNLDWSDPLALVVTTPHQTGIGNAGTLSSSYAGYDVQVTGFASNPGTFSWCDDFITLRMNPGVTGLGYFNVLLEVKLER